MCGIVAAISKRDIVPILLEGLRRLEYRGYDSCGIATLNEGSLTRVRTVSRVHELAECANEDDVTGTIRFQRRNACHPFARELWTTLAYSPCVAVATSCIPYSAGSWHRRGQASKSS